MIVSRVVRGLSLGAVLCATVGARAADGGTSSPAPVPAGSGARAVFFITFEARGTSNNDMSATSKVEVGLAPATEWGAHTWTNFGSFGKAAADESTPAKLFRLRGGLAGLRPDEPMDFGVLSHKGTAHASSGRTLNGPGSIQQVSSRDFSLADNVARFRRTKDGGVLTCIPIVYQDDEPVEFGLLGPGTIPFRSADAEAYEKLTTFRFTNAELADLRRVRKVNEATVTTDDGSMQQWFRSTLTGAAPADETEVSVTAEEYDTWIPEGNLEAPGKKGNRITVRLEAYKKDDPAAKRRAKLDLTFTKVSMEKGICMNWPSQGAKSDYGLRILEEENPDLEVLGPDHARTREEVESVDLIVTAHDFGAWGTLHVSARDERGEEAKVKVRGEEKADLDLPRDENHNHVADEWETKWAGGLRGQETDDEDDTPAGDGDTGDVLSLYEEYRGFRISGGAELNESGGRPRELMTGYHVRTDPRTKDVFICDTTGLGIGAFRASGLRVHLVKQAECGRSQAGAFNTHVVNFNRGAWSKGEQYVLWLESGNPGNGYVGEAVMKGGTPGVPRDCQRIVVGAPAAAGSPWLRPDEDTQVTLTHELAHACNVKHHGEKYFEVVRAQRLADQVEEPAKGTVLVGERGGSSAGGDVHCYMGYTANFVQEPNDPDYRVWDAEGKSYLAKMWKVSSPRFAKTRFCSEPDSWELGPAGPPAADRGDCLHQFCVNHLKH